MLPVIDLSEPGLPAKIEAACRDTGFFYVAGHGVPRELRESLDSAARAFFSLPDKEKNDIEMARGGRAWRGWFPVGAELTAGEQDRKEGLYFGTELPAGHPLPLHGPNLFPAQVPTLRPLVLSYLDELTRVAQDVLRGVAASLGLAEDYFAAGYTANPTVLFRIFHYPPAQAGDPGWGVGEHTDYGLLTLLLQDDNGGLQVHTPDGWTDAPPLPDTFVCNIGDMLERLTGGWYRSTPHRVRNTSGRDRLSFPFFFDPDFGTSVPPLPDRAAVAPDGRRRWDGASPLAFEGTYGDYLTAKVAKVFPRLRSELDTQPF
ncbi:isopenicillin N synthase family dioxygenase [Actinophytocola algeriensis]|uniref:Isopenicillin N synthase-like dioxygenase n=1 Tax=Actinophytocola algeriensis TaxID=1768010 RepID=A0A7W7QDT9_9PSEU|nr:isopenicillin N synthase family oxygenase [Actinophytocola algeriensis]MBB4911792.1 isopenicillin N synthase-like dioxygenase [Actinophytocola algeriensis]MBE1477716.1 isopenicillin N synthase-like dioxygenase [Actinophytocola algeriensis]